MSTEKHSDVIVIGAGAAGLSAAVALSGAGARVSLLERKPYVGGRAYSYPHPALEEVIDSQHVLLGCCTNLIDLSRLCGADRHISWCDEINFLEPASEGRKTTHSVIRPGPLSSPTHYADAFLRAPMLTLRDKTRIAFGLMQFLRGYPISDAEPFSAWLASTHQTDRAIRHFWEPIVVATLNDSFDRCSTRYAAQVFYESFLKSAQGGRLGIPTQPLSDFYAAVAKLAEQQGTKLHLRIGVDSIARLTDGQWQATATDGTIHNADNLVLALPFEQAARLLETLPENEAARAQTLPLFEHFTHAPITTLHLWFDREITQIDHAALLDTRIQWMFNKSRIRRDEPSSGIAPGQYLELVISASFAELSQTREQILPSALAELARFFPSVREARLTKSGILKEARATFSVTPGLDAFRPAAATVSPGLFLAGDWTRTGWPSTMEGAVRSGRLAAEAVSQSAGTAAKFLSPDLPASGLMRFFSA
ncbi:MAG: hydroxysqualene dehydroxylase HpnE [Acidobacteriota bacterium]|nr:hydroxysqualene dehydroxylase HpnE [Acidobacteriota bacterium]